MIKIQDITKEQTEAYLSDITDNLDGWMEFFNKYGIKEEKDVHEIIREVLKDFQTYVTNEDN